MHVIFSDLPFKQKQEEIAHECRMRLEQGLYDDARHEAEAHGIIARIVERLFPSETPAALGAKHRRAS